MIPTKAQKRLLPATTATFYMPFKRLLWGTTLATRSTPEGSRFFMCKRQRIKRTRVQEQGMEPGTTPGGRLLENRKAEFTTLQSMAIMMTRSATLTYRTLDLPLCKAASSPGL